MTKDMMNFRDLVEQAPDADSARDDWLCRRTADGVGGRDRDGRWLWREGSVTPRPMWRAVANQIRPKVPKLATIMDDAEEDVLGLHDLP
jgi:hypothetical protein